MNTNRRLVVVPLPEEGLYELHREYGVIMEVKDKSRLKGVAVKEIVVPRGFRWDGASIPSFFWTTLMLTPFDPMVLRASMVHDYLYQEPQGLKREDIDKLFHTLLLEDGMDERRAQQMYDAVATFGSLFTTALDEPFMNEEDLA